MVRPISQLRNAILRIFGAECETINPLALENALGDVEKLTINRRDVNVFLTNFALFGAMQTVCIAVPIWGAHQSRLRGQLHQTAQ